MYHNLPIEKVKEPYAPAIALFDDPIISLYSTTMARTCPPQKYPVTARKKQYNSKLQNVEEFYLMYVWPFMLNEYDKIFSIVIMLT